MKNAISLVCLFVAFGCGASEQESETKVINGVDAAANEYPSVVQIRTGNSVCSANFVSPTTLLTAAHCIDAGSDVYFGDIKAAWYLRHPSFTWTSAGFDLAIVVFSDDVAPAFTPIVSDKPAIGDQLTIVGFGDHELYGENRRSGIKRIGRNQISSLDYGRIGFTGADENAQAINGDDALNAHGDSGGPLFINGRQAGISASITVAPRGERRFGFYTNLTSLKSRPILRRAQNRGADIR